MYVRMYACTYVRAYLRTSMSAFVLQSVHRRRFGMCVYVCIYMTIGIAQLLLKQSPAPVEQIAILVLLLLCIYYIF